MGMTPPTVPEAGPQPVEPNPLEKPLRDLVNVVEWMFGGTDELAAPGPIRKAYRAAVKALGEKPRDVR
jgi:hypothetical protein